MIEMIFIDTLDDNKILGRAKYERVLKPGEGIHLDQNICRPVLKVERKKVGDIEEIWVYLGQLPEDVLTQSNVEMLYPPKNWR